MNEDDPDLAYEAMLIDEYIIETALKKQQEQENNKLYEVLEWK